MYGIPEFRLPKDIVQEEIGNLEKLGVELRCNFVVGKTATVNELMGEWEYSAVFIATGAGLPYFMGIPGEKYGDLEKTRALRRRITRRFRNIGRAWTSPITLEPGAPWHEDPKAFGIVTTRRSFDDFYRASSPDGGGMGYAIPDYLEKGGDLEPIAFERLLRDARCRRHCSLHPNPSKASSPFWGRLYCRYLNKRMGGVGGKS